jgi:methionyl-tRNA formyltransferase
MKIGYFADGVWAHRALDKILDSGQIEVAFIVARFDRADPVLREYAERLRIPFLLHADVNSEEFISVIKAHAPDLNVSMSFNQILKKPVLQAAPLGFINCHAGALPYYRGRNILNWALINGETRFGVTVHHIDEGIDTGDIVVQRYAEISKADNYQSLLAKAVVLCAETLSEALGLIASGQAPRTVQSSIHPLGFYCSRRRPGDEWLDWSWTSEQIHNFVRAISPPGPGARTSLRGNEIAVVGTELIPDAPSYIDKPGAVVGRDKQGCVIKTGDKTIYVTAIADVGIGGELEKPRVPAPPVGTRLGVSAEAKLRELEDRVRTLEERLGAQP